MEEEYAAREARTVERPREVGGRRKLAERAYKFGWAEHVQEARGVNSRRRYASQARAANDTSQIVPSESTAVCTEGPLSPSPTGSTHGGRSAAPPHVHVQALRDSH